ncbi:MAG: GNAT family N-acetyltransferase [Clostridiales bacterium]|nr:GNAT family N-acetyltransferase [Clostridiales bacterium]
MRKLNDLDVDLSWEIYTTKEVATAKKTNKHLLQLLTNLNTWESQNINDFITYTPQIKLGNFIFSNLTQNYNIRNDRGKGFSLVVAYEENEIVGIAILNSKSHDISIDFKLDDNNTTLRIEYIIVNPNFQNQGVGTRMIKSITDHQKYFSSNKVTNGVVADIDNENTNSRKAFLKNNFRIVMPASYISKYFSRVYHTSKQPNKNKEL